MKTLPTFSHHVVKSASKTDLWRLNGQDDVSVAAYQEPGVLPPAFRCGLYSGRGACVISFVQEQNKCLFQALMAKGGG